MAGLGPVQSANGEITPTPRIRRDQYRKILHLVRNNAEFPQVALGLVRDAIQHAPHVRAILLNEDNTAIRLCLLTPERMEAEYIFPLEAPLLCETPTSDLSYK